MPKRKHKEKIDYYTKKIQYLQQQKEHQNIKRRRLIIYSSSSESEENADNGTVQDDNDLTLAHGSLDQEPDQQITAPPLLEPTLDPELLAALGDTGDDQPPYGEDIHESLAQRWLPILKKGLPKETKDKLLKEHSIPSNCKLLRAPTLNPEINAAVQDIVRNRDKNIQMKQDQLGLGLSVINKAITILLTGDDKLQAIKTLSDGCRLLSDLHFTETQVRTKLITPCLDRSFIPILQDLERDETLFGSKLSDKIKASKAITKQGLQIKKTVALNKTGTSLTLSSATYNPRYQGNWQSSPRYPSSNRGGRGGQSLRTFQPHRRPPVQHSTYQPRTSSSRSRQRVPTRP